MAIITSDLLVMIPSNCGTRPVAIPHGLAGSTGRDFDGRFWKSIINIKIYKSPNEKSRPVGGAHGFGPFGLIQKIPPGQFWIFDHIIILLMQIIYCFISFLLQVPTSYEPGSESCRVAAARFGAMVPLDAGLP